MLAFIIALFLGHSNFYSSSLQLKFYFLVVYTLRIVNALLSETRVAILDY